MWVLLSSVLHIARCASSCVCACGYNYICEIVEKPSEKKRWNNQRGQREKIVTRVTHNHIACVHRTMCSTHIRYRERFSINFSMWICVWFSILIKTRSRYTRNKLTHTETKTMWKLYAWTVCIFRSAYYKYTHRMASDMFWVYCHRSLYGLATTVHVELLAFVVALPSFARFQFSLWRYILFSLSLPLLFCAVRCLRVCFTITPPISFSLTSVLVCRYPFCI